MGKKWAMYMADRMWDIAHRAFGYITMDEVIGTPSSEILESTNGSSRANGE